MKGGHMEYADANEASTSSAFLATASNVRAWADPDLKQEAAPDGGPHGYREQWVANKFTPGLKQSACFWCE
ncbi:hypothetical protein [Paraburkholderia fungorum]|uniref:hypothetical protein n=1 Tax=Paraburkholderia fungorum TaxID=134537 RepID=UPI002097C49B|nr:hypothetical protein [Paraburkholderia fungorum]